MARANPERAARDGGVHPALTAAAHEHQARLIKTNTARPGVVALPATPEAAAAHAYADTTARPAVAVRNFDSGRVSLPLGSLVIVEVADQLPPDQLRFLVEQAAVRTKTKLVLITNPGNTDRTGPEISNAVTALQDCLPWARHIGTPREREHAVRQRDRPRPTAPHHRQRRQFRPRRGGPAAGPPGGRRSEVPRPYRDEVTARDRFTTDIARTLSRSRSRDDGLEL